MKAFYFLQIDRVMAKLQERLIWLFIAIALLLSIYQGNPYWGPLYMVFGSMILSTTPFTISQVSNSGFLLMLPATIKDRVIGRFFYGLFLMIIALLFGGINAILVCVIKHIELSSVFLIFYIGIASVGLSMLSIQNTVLYIIGEFKSQQILAVVRMIPGFLLFIMGTIVMEIMEEETNTEAVFSSILWINHHLMECAILLLLIGILVFLAGIFISVQVQKKRDFA